MSDNKFIDLFSGTGAFSHVFENNGYECVFANDICDSSKKIYDINHKTSLTLKDLQEIKTKKIPKHNILCGGFPCQPFSIAGKQKGFDDKRANVFWSIISILKKRKPNIIVLENVKNLHTHDNGNTFKIIKKELRKCNYHIKYSILNTSVLTTIPHNRERIYIVGFLDKKLYKRFNFKFKEQKTKNIKDFLDNNIDKKYYYSDRFKVYAKIKEAVTKHINTNTIYQYRRYYVRENKTNVCPTLTANMGGGGHNVPIIKDDIGIRKITPRECFNLQGFPTEYKLPNISDSKLYKLAGNAVSIPIVDLIVKKISSLETQNDNIVIKNNKNKKKVVRKI